MKDLLNLWTIFFNPLDQPNKYVMRRFEVGNGAGRAVPTNDAVISDSIEPLRAEMKRRGLHCLPREDLDHESVVETWL